MSLWEEDFTEVRGYLDRLRAAGVTDFQAYFREHPEAVRQCAAKVKILDVNQAALTLNNAASKQELLAGLPLIFIDESYDTFRKVLLAIVDRKTVFDLEGSARTLQGEKRQMLLRWAVAPGNEETLSRVYVSQTDISEHKRLQNDVALRERQLKSFFQGAMAGLALLDKDLRYIQVNDTLAEMNGLPAAEHIGKSVREVVPQIPQWSSQYYKRVLATGDPILNIEVTSETQSYPGIQRHWMESFFPVPGVDGSVDGVGAIVVEITDRKRAEEHILASHERLKLAQQAANAGLWDWDMLTGKLTWSEEFYELFGLSPRAEASFDTWLAIMHPDDRELAMARINRDIEERKPHQSEYRIIRPDGKERWINPLGSTSYDEASRPVRMTGICIDITECKRAEEALAESEKRYRSLFDTINEGFALHEIICDADGAPCDYRFLEINPAFEALTGLNREEVLGKTLREVLPKEDPAWIKIYGEVALTGKSIRFDNYSAALNRHYEVFAYSPARASSLRCSWI